MPSADGFDIAQRWKRKRPNYDNPIHTYIRAAGPVAAGGAGGAGRGTELTAMTTVKKPRVVKHGCLWIVLKYGHPVYGWFYDRCHNTWREAFEYALSGTSQKEY
jgi:hypothetical protein